MKRLLMLAAALLLAAGANAQDWKEALKKAAATAVDNATDGKLTQYALTGAWNYTGPGVKFEGGDAASTLGASAIETTLAPKLERAYRMAGIEPGACSFSFDREGAFTAVFGKRSMSGTYQFDPAAHVITLHFAKGKLDLGSVPGHAYVNGDKLQLVFPVTKLVGLVTELGSKISSLKAVTALLEKYEDVYLGFEFGR